MRVHHFNGEATRSPTSSGQTASSSMMYSLVRRSVGESVESNDGNIITDTGHNLIEGNWVVFTSGPLDNQEIPVVKVIDANTYVLGATITQDLSGSNYDSYYPIVPKTDSNGNFFVSQSDLTVVDVIDAVDNGDGNLVPLRQASGGSPIAGRGGSFTEIVASLAADVKKIEVYQDFGYRLGLYSGGLGSEVLLCVLPLTPDYKTDIDIPSGTRLSIRSLESDSITSGAFAANFLG